MTQPGYHKIAPTNRGAKLVGVGEKAAVRTRVGVRTLILIFSSSNFSDHFNVDMPPPLAQDLGNEMLSILPNARTRLGSIG